DEMSAWKTFFVIIQSVKLGLIVKGRGQLCNCETMVLGDYRTLMNRFEHFIRDDAKTACDARCHEHFSRFKPRHY
uniref:hypothetical protein n=1 Tax=Pseudomonas viridiflava TaxID=33069 RepID=UPI0019677705